MSKKVTQLTFTCSNLTIETLEKDAKWRRSGASVVNFQHILQLFLVFKIMC